MKNSQKEEKSNVKRKLTAHLMNSTAALHFEQWMLPPRVTDVSREGRDKEWGKGGREVCGANSFVAAKCD